MVATFPSLPNPIYLGSPVSFINYNCLLHFGFFTLSDPFCIGFIHETGEMWLHCPNHQTARRSPSLSLSSPLSLVSRALLLGR